MLRGNVYYSATCTIYRGNPARVNRNVLCLFHFFNRLPDVSLQYSNLLGMGHCFAWQVTRPICINFVNSIWSLFIYLLSCGKTNINWLSSCVQIRNDFSYNEGFQMIFKHVGVSLLLITCWHHVHIYHCLYMFISTYGFRVNQLIGNNSVTMTLNVLVS